jgi:hypothetical protein
MDAVFNGRVSSPMLASSRPSVRTRSGVVILHFPGIGGKVPVTSSRGTITRILTFQIESALINAPMNRIRTMMISNRVASTEAGK